MIVHKIPVKLAQVQLKHWIVLQKEHIKTEQEYLKGDKLEN